MENQAIWVGTEIEINIVLLLELILIHEILKKNLCTYFLYSSNIFKFELVQFSSFMLTSNYYKNWSFCSTYFKCCLQCFYHFERYVMVKSITDQISLKINDASVKSELDLNMAKSVTCLDIVKDAPTSNLTHCDTRGDTLLHAWSDGWEKSR